MNQSEVIEAGIAAGAVSKDPWALSGVLASLGTRMPVVRAGI